MLQRVLIAAATAGLLAVGAFAAPPASAASVSFTLTATSAPYGNAYGYYHPRPHLVCTPTYKRVTTWYHGHPYTHWVRTGQSCHWVYPSAPRPPRDRNDRY
jgi:hypothetical protein